MAYVTHMSQLAYISYVSDMNLPLLYVRRFLVRNLGYQLLRVD